MFDVAIVGGGLAGCATALELRRQRLRVAVIDRERFPRDKPCGEGLLPAGVVALEKLGLGERLRALGAPEFWSIEWVLDGVRARGELPGRGLGLERLRFDATMASAACDAGVVWIHGRPSALLFDRHGRACGLLLEGGTRLEAGVVIGADGLRSWTRRALGLSVPYGSLPRYGLCAKVQVSGSSGDGVEVHVMPGLGELYVSPTGARQISLALLATRKGLAVIDGRLDAAVRRAIAKAPSLGRRLGDARWVGRVLATGPLAVRAVRPYRAGALLVGDAAFAMDPIGGDGMTLALLGASVCARAACALLAGNEEEQVGTEYVRALRELSRRRRWFVDGLLALVSRPRLARLSLRALATVPSLVSTLCAVHEGM